MFPPTAWSMVRLAVAEGRPGADQALDQLCRQYERPILAYILRSGCPPDAAEDLKQAFFVQLLAKNTFADAEGTRVRLRAFLITKLQGFLIDRHRHDMALKRGGGKVIRLGDMDEAQQMLVEPVDLVTPLIAFQRQWMETLAGHAMTQLRADFVARGQVGLYDAIAPFITHSSEESIAALSARLGRPEGTLKSDISRLRTRCQELIRSQIAATLDDPTPANIDAELKELMGCRGN
jgi:RNA polymerase sigma-70 factor (ECF subfamily)